MKNPFESLNALFKSETPSGKQTLHHSQEQKIIDHALNMLALSSKGQELLDFVREKDLKISVLRGLENRDFVPTKTRAYLSVSDSASYKDPANTIYMIGAIREAMHEYDPMLRRVPYENGESIYIQREEKKLSDKLQYQTIIVYELGKFANKPEFIDSFLYMGYYSLIDAYEKDLMEN